VLDMLSGRYPSDEFAELRPRLVWDRLRGTARDREGARQIVVANAGTIPDKGLFGVFLAEDPGAPPGTKRRAGRRVGELDEEMVFESFAGDCDRPGRDQLARARDRPRARAGRARAG
jgi:ATP-dependent Lhr-like helicase